MIDNDGNKHVRQCFENCHTPKPLALWQAHYVKDALMANHPGLVVELVPMVTRGDVIWILRWRSRGKVYLSRAGSRAVRKTRRYRRAFHEGCAGRVP